MYKAILLTGGNEGDVAATLAAARERVRECVGPIAAASSLYRSAPWGYFDSPQQDFLNQALIVETHLSPIELLDATQRIEQELGRPKGAASGELTSTASAVRRRGWRLSAWFRFAKPAHARVYTSRPIDIDILFYDDLVMQTERLTIPHPLIQDREFALEPLAEIAPGYLHPVLGITVDEMLRRSRAGRTPL